jgi:F0F1-type ATP synthase assembly protein I
LNQRKLSGWEKHLGIGLQLAMTVLLGAAAGYFFDHRYETLPRWTLVGLVLSLFAGFFNFAVQVRDIVAEDESDSK